MKSLPVNDNIQMEGTVSQNQIFCVGPRFCFMMENGKHIVISFLTLFFIS